jgi:hypothetical protein
MRRERGADRRTLASEAAAPALIGRGDDTTAGGEPERSRSNAAADAAAYARAYARPIDRAETERQMGEVRAMLAEYRRRRGAEIEAMAADWMGSNPDAMRYIERRALEETAAGRRFSVRLLLEEARKRGFSDREGRGTKINNVIAPAVARALIREHPEVRPFVKLRRSMVDEVR